MSQQSTSTLVRAPSVGRLVHYRLSAKDAETINHRRTQHVGNPANEGDILPMIMVRVWPGDTHGVNGQVLLDGNDQLWVTSVAEGDGPGTWSSPPRV